MRRTRNDSIKRFSPLMNRNHDIHYWRLAVGRIEFACASLNIYGHQVEVSEEGNGKETYWLFSVI